MTDRDDVRAMYRAYKEGSLHRFWGPRTVEIEITNRCNLKCKMCHRWKWQKRESRLSLPVIEELVGSARKLGGQNILVSGGEPLLRPDFVDIVRAIHAAGLTIILFTNATLMTEAAAEALVSGSTRFVFSIDSSKARIYEEIRGVKGAWQRAITGVKLAVSKNRQKGGQANLGINYTVQKDNVGDMLATAELAEQLGLDYIRFGLVHGQEKVGLDRAELPILAHQIEALRELKNHVNLDIFGSRYFPLLLDGTIDVEEVQQGMPAVKLFQRHPLPCHICSQYTLVDNFGDVYPCTYGYLDNDPDDEETQRLRSRNQLGNIFRQSLEHIWTGKRYSHFRRRHDPVNIKSDRRVCGQCEHYFALETIDHYLEKIDRLGGEVEKMDDQAWCGCDHFETSI
jgi:MoaA/NifB/PqqE/SkfB family radical SAM enzyme